MLRDLDQKVLDLDGNEFSPTLTLGSVCFHATAGVGPDETTMPVDKKLALYKLAKKVHAGGSVDLTIEELATLKERIGKSFSTLVVGVTFELLEKE